MQKIASKLNRKHPGVTSLLFVLAIGLVLVVMVAGIAALTVREQQQASNTELSNRALQTAEAGVKAAVQKLDANPAYSKTECPPGADFSSLSLGPGQSISCIIVSSISTTTYEGYLESDKSQEFYAGPDINSANVSPAYLKFSWNNVALGDSANPSFLDTLYPRLVQGYSNAAFIELSIIYWPRSNASPASFKNETFLIAPVDSSATDANANARRSVKATCSTGAGYNCTTTNATGQQGFNVATALNLVSPDNVDNYNFDIRVTPRYANTHFQLTAYGLSSSATSRSLVSNLAQIDVTGKAGNLYRRIKAQRQVKPTVLDGVFTSVLFAGKGDDNNSQRDICKTFSVRPNIVNNVTQGYYVGTANMDGAKPNCNNLPYN